MPRTDKRMAAEERFGPGGYTYISNGQFVGNGGAREYLASSP